jgi:succinate dehydrogenase/fumarate reductase flavoprotein subunit
MIEAGEDLDFSRFVTAEDAPPRIERPPFYAIQFFPMTRKSMGGVTIDMQGRALNDHGDVIPGLYAIGELTGSVGINGKHGMDGMFLGPAVLTGRIAGRTIAAAHANRDGMLELRAPVAEDSMPAPGDWEPSLTATELEALLATPRNGYWHFERSHELVLERQYQCTDCHSAEVPFFLVNNRASKLAQAELCSTCHGR